MDVYQVGYLNGEEGRETLMIDICNVLRNNCDLKVLLENGSMDPLKVRLLILQMIVNANET